MYGLGRLIPHSCTCTCRSKCVHVSCTIYYTDYSVLLLLQHKGVVARQAGREGGGGGGGGGGKGGGSREKGEEGGEGGRELEEGSRRRGAFLKATIHLATFTTCTTCHNSKKKKKAVRN